MTNEVDFQIDETWDIGNLHNIRLTMLNLTFWTDAELFNLQYSALFEVASINAKGHLYNLLVAVKLGRKVGRNAQWVYEMQG